MNSEKNKKNSVEEIFKTQAMVEGALQSLKDRGFRNDDICVLMTSFDQAVKFAREKSTKAPNGDIASALSDMGISEYDRKRYEERINNGSFLISVGAEDSNWLQKAKTILKEAGSTSLEVPVEKKISPLSKSNNAGAHL